MVDNLSDLDDQSEDIKTAELDDVIKELNEAQVSAAEIIKESKENFDLEVDKSNSECNSDKVVEEPNNQFKLKFNNNPSMAGGENKNKAQSQVMIYSIFKF